MSTTNDRKKLPLLIVIGFITGLGISAVDNFAFGGEVSPIVIVTLLLTASGVCSALYGRLGSLISVAVWICIPLVHLVKHILNLPDSINPNTFGSIIKLAIFTFVVSAIGSGIGVLFHGFIKDTVKSN